MSVLNKTPFINSVLKALGKDNLETLRDLMNGEGNRTVLFRTMEVPSGNRAHISSADYGVHLCNLQIISSLFNGYLLYKEGGACVLLSFTDFQNVNIFNIDMEKYSIAKISEYLDINELRYIVNDLLVQEGEMITVQVDDIDSGSTAQGKVIVSDGEGGAEWGNSVSIKEVDALPASGEEDTIYLSNTNAVSSSDELIEIPAPVGVGKVLKVGANGYELGDISGGTKLYKHEIQLGDYFGSHDRIVLILTDSAPITELSMLATYLSNKYDYATGHIYINGLFYGYADGSALYGCPILSDANEGTFSYVGADTYYNQIVDYDYSTAWATYHSVDTVTEL